jgi:hypothetical protein
MRRVVAAFAGIGIMVAAIVPSCGGRIFDGHFDDSGDYFGSDGGLIFGPGSSCEGYDAAGLANTLGQWEQGVAHTSISCDANSACVLELPKGLSQPFSGAAPGEYELEEISCHGTCSTVRLNPRPCPSPDETGNHFCRQFYQQFVAADGAAAQASCVKCTPDNVPGGRNGVCTNEFHLRTGLLPGRRLLRSAWDIVHLRIPV